MIAGLGVDAFVGDALPDVAIGDAERLALVFASCCVAVTRKIFPMTKPPRRPT